ncbi:MAG: dihydrolipoamide acetyltransferase family protein [Gammaproteobacteria bacterium]
MATFNLPDLGEGLAEAEIVRWHVNVGDTVKVDQPMVAVETAKAVVEVPSPYTGRIQALHGKPGDVVATGAPLVEFDVQASTSTAPAAKKDAPVAQKADPRRADDSGTVVGSMPTSDEELVENAVAGSDIASPRDRVRAAPAVRALAKRLGVDLTSVRGTGRGGLITVDDVMTTSGPTAMQAAATVTALKTTPPAIKGQAPIASYNGEPEKLRGLRRAMHQTMSLSRDNVMNCTVFDDADLHEWRKGQDYTVRLLRAIGVAAAAEPALNAWYDGENQIRRPMSRVDVAMAVDSPEGLLVPVVRDVQRPTAEVRADVNRLKRSARDRTVTPEDLRDFTFMLSNFGMIAGRYGTPVVVPPAVAILGAGRLSHDVVAVMGAIEAHLRMPLSLTFDHRCVTGGEAVRFLAALIQDLEKGS